MPATEYLANLIAKASKNGTAYQGPSTIYLALVTDIPTRTVAGTEPTDTDYDRLTFAQSGWTDDNAGTLSNTNVLQWPAADADYPEDVEAIEAYTAASGGTRLWWAPLDQAMVVLDAQQPELLAGELIWPVV
jgi:hypothetical protein